MFIPIGMFPNSEQIAGLPDMAKVAEMMQKQKSSEAVSTTESSNEGTPPENIKEVDIWYICKNLND